MMMMMYFRRCWAELSSRLFRQVLPQPFAGAFDTIACSSDVTSSLSSSLLRLLYQSLHYSLDSPGHHCLPPPRSMTPMDFSFEGLAMGGHSVHLREESGVAQDRRLVAIDMLPDDVLVEIFFYVNIQVRDRDRNILRVDPWHTLVHVCRRWRYLVFASPRHLNLRLRYRGHRPMSEALDAWPVLPISLRSNIAQSGQQWNNVVSAALESEHSNRISEINISHMAKSRWERFTAAMQKPFPQLTRLQVWTVKASRLPVLPDSFLGGSAPLLQTLWLEGIPFPSIPKLLLSANGLVELTLLDIPESGYFSPNAMATALTAMTRLESLDLRFDSPRSRPDPGSQPLPPPTRFVLPSLTKLVFKGVYEYLEDLLARIDPPLLYDLYIEFFMDLDFEVPQLHRLICHAEQFKTFDRAEISISKDSIQLHLYPITVEADDGRLLELQINCRELDHQLSSLCQVCSSSFPFMSALPVEDLQIRERRLRLSSPSKDDMENAQWLELLDLFTALKDLYVTSGLAPHVCGALQELSGERATEVLPALRNIFVQSFSSLEPVQKAMNPFLAARQLSGHPVVVDPW